MTKRRAALAVCLALLVAAFSLPAPGGDVQPAEFSADTDNLYRQLELFSTVLELARSHYVDEVSNQDLIYGALEGMLSALDPYSGFMKPEFYGEMQVETKGEFGGVGIEITMRNGILTVISPIEGTPASRAGVHPGDRIVKIEGEPTDGITLMKAVSLLRGKPDTDVTITVLRAGESKLLDFKITRDIIKIESVKEARLLPGEIGYIRLTQFQQKTSGDLRDRLRELSQKGMRGLILDVRYNPGGLLTAAIEAAEFFLPRDRVVVKTVGRGERVDMEVKTSSDGEFVDLPLVVLINEGSASGAEIVAGALRDNDRAILVGAKTFGKGSVQTVLPMPGDSGVRLTTGHYHTASGRVIHEKGIEPDILVELTLEQKYDLIARKYRGLQDVAGLEMESATPEEKILRRALEKIFEEERSIEEQRVLEMVVEKLMEQARAEVTGEESPDEPAAEENEEPEEKQILDLQLDAALGAMKAILLERNFARERK